jgi:hypothetical protein
MQSGINGAAKTLRTPKDERSENIKGIDDARIVGKASAEVGANIRGYWVSLECCSWNAGAIESKVG